MLLKKEKNVVTNNATFYQFDSQMGFWGCPNIERDVKFEQHGNFINVRHNSEGNRDNEIILDDNERTIVCLGGSHTWGAAVDLNSRYTNLLEKTINRRVVNLAHCSLGLDQNCIAILSKTLRFNPDTIIVEQHPWAVHRVLNNYVEGYVKPHFYIDNDDELQLRKIPTLTKIQLFRKIIGNYHAFNKEFIEYKAGINLKAKPGTFVDPIFACWKSRHYDYMYDLIGRILVVIRDFCIQNEIKLLFALGTLKEQLGTPSLSRLVDYDLPRKRLIKLLEENQVNYVDTTKKMLSEDTDAKPIIFEDGHINEKGHKLFSQILQKSLIKLN